MLGKLLEKVLKLLLAEGARAVPGCTDQPRAVSERGSENARLVLGYALAARHSDY